MNSAIWSSFMWTITATSARAPFRGRRRWFDPITGARCDLYNPASVCSAIKSGAIGMGSFLTPILHVARHAEVRHLCQPPKARTTMDHHIRITTEQDTLLDPGRNRPAVRLDPSAAEIGPESYRITPSVEARLDRLGDGPNLLHIDMDYFNNRYDGTATGLTDRRRLIHLYLGCMKRLMS